MLKRAAVCNLLERMNSWKPAAPLTHSSCKSKQKPYKLFNSAAALWHYIHFMFADGTLYWIIIISWLTSLVRTVSLSHAGIHLASLALFSHLTQAAVMSRCGALIDTPASYRDCPRFSWQRCPALWYAQVCVWYIYVRMCATHLCTGTLWRYIQTFPELCLLWGTALGRLHIRSVFFLC